MDDYISDEIAEQVDAYIDRLAPIPDGDPAIALYSLGLWLRIKFGLGRHPLYETLSQVNEKSVSRLKEFAVALIGWCVDETPPGSHLEHLILLYPGLVEAEEMLADLN